MMVDDQYKNATTVAAPAQVKDADLEERVKAEQAKFPNLPPKYVGFTIRYKCFWIVMNLIGILTSAAMGAGSVMIMKRDHD